MKRISAIYAIVMGIALLTTWIQLLIFDTDAQVAAWQAAPFQVSFLLLAEVMTGLALVLGGYGILAGRRWGPGLNFVALGMMLYTIVHSIGVFGQAGNRPATIAFTVLSLLTILVLAGLLRPPSAERPERVAGSVAGR